MHRRAASRDTNDIGYSYVEVSLTDRRLVLYKSGTPVVDTGIAISSSTPDGVYSIEEKKTGVSVGNMTADCWLSFTDDLGIYGDPGLNLSAITDTEEDSFGSTDYVDFSSDMTDWIRHRRLYCTAGRGCTGTVSECRNRHARWLFINSE